MSAVYNPFRRMTSGYYGGLEGIMHLQMRGDDLYPFEALVEQQEACLIPEQALDAVLATAAEQEKCRLVRVQMEPQDDQSSKPVDGLPHVRMATGQIDVLRREFSD